MDVDRWIIGRTEEVMTEVLKLTGQPEEMLFSIMADAMSGHPGILHLAGSLQFFDSVEFQETPKEEAADVTDEFRLCTDDPLGTLDDVASKTIVGWCNFYFEYTGLIMIAQEGTDLGNLGGRIILRESSEEESEEEPQ